VDNKSNDPRFNFSTNPTLDELIAQPEKARLRISACYKATAGWPDDEFEHSLRPCRIGAVAQGCRMEWFPKET
jgi:hypothetical protein